MTREEAARLVAALGGAWPTFTIGAETYEVWFNSALANSSFEVGLEVVMFVVENDQRFPTPARFHEVRRLLSRRDDPKALDAAPTTPEEQARGHAVIARIRVELEACGSPWGDYLRPHLPPKGWTPRHVGDVTDGSWMACQPCHGGAA